MPDTKVMKRVARKTSTKGQKKKSAGKKPNTQSIRREKYNTLLNSMQDGTQSKKVLKHLIQKGSTTSLEIMGLFYITNPTAVISDLRKKGAKISMSYIVKNDTDGSKVRFGKFTLEV